jgi:hypothetical protein
MKNFIALLAPPSSGNGNWDNNTGKLKQLFKGLTGYDIMFEESRKDLVLASNALGFTQSTQSFSLLLSNSIKNIAHIIGARMM